MLYKQKFFTKWFGPFRGILFKGYENILKNLVEAQSLK